MLLHELSRLCHVHPETIRMYRKLGLISARKDPKNGYYTYDHEALQQLLHLRKLRGSGLSLEAIRCTQESRALEEVVTRYENDLTALDEQIAALQRRKAMLQVTLEHLRQYEENLQGVTLLEAADTRYDLVFRTAQAVPALDIWVEKMEFCTLGIHVRLEDMLRRPLPEFIHADPSIGSYRNIIEQNGLPLPPEAICSPKGLYAAAHVELDGLGHLRRDQLTPLLDFIAAQEMRPVSDGTAFLVRILSEKGKKKFIYRLRVRVEPLEPDHP